LKVGDRVASSAPHSEYAVVNVDHAVKVPENVSDEEATFATLAATVMNGVPDWQTLSWEKASWL